jgi:glucan phosphoethanolaminetransferase (alkaline phosphatase superfamily)
MSKKLSLILTIVTALIGLIAFYFFIRIVMVGDETIETDAAVQASLVSPFISFAVYLLGITAIIAVVFSLLNLIKNPQVLKTTMLGLGVLAVLLVVAYATAGDGAVTDGVGKVLEQSGSISKWVSTGINFSAILGGVGLLFFVVDFGKSLVK